MKIVNYLFLSFLTFLLFNEYVISQNTGPNTIDYVASQPPDATNMVTLPTGDFSYVLKLLEVPGPEGNYPVQLIYRSGITIDQESSWVGLGWSLFPGAITRTVNGVPDDWKEKKVYNLLHNTTNYTVNLGYGLSGYASLGLQRLLGYNRSLFGYSKRTWKNFQLPVKYYSGPLYFKDALHNINTSNSDYGGIKFSNGYCLDVYFSRDGENLEDYDMLDKKNSLTFPNYDQYVVNARGLSGIMTPRIHELFTLPGDGRIITQDGDGNASEEYSYHYNSNKDFLCSKTKDDIYFAFDYSHDSYLKIKDDNFYNDTLDLGSDPNTKFYLDNEAGVREDELPTEKQAHYNDITNFNSTTERRGGSRYVEYFTNNELVNSLQVAKSRGFIEAEITPVLDRSNTDLFDPDGIGAFTITAADGSNYYFSLPVYQFEQFFRDETYNTNEFYEKRQLDKYAYAWLLTAITGPDYVDNGDGILNDGDVGFWIKFSYGKWTDGYLWRTPYNDRPSAQGSEGQNKNGYQYDVTGVHNDPSFIHNISHWGRKQIYYLNSITTRSHTAYFIKSLRNDAKGKAVSYSENNFLAAQNISANIYESSLLDDKSTYIHDIRYQTTVNLSSIEHKVLKLDKIIVVENNDANLSTQNITNLCTSVNGNISFSNSYENITHTNGTSVASPNDIPTISRSFTMYYQDNILDVNDLSTTGGIPDIQQKAIKIIELEHDYSLANGTLNSSSGKLSLNKVKFLSKDNNELIPSYDFTYNSCDYTFSNNWSNYGYVPTTTTIDQTAWSLNQIKTPEGAKINIVYERDSAQYQYYIGDATQGLHGGDGCRVKQIYTDDDKDNIYRTFYNYKIPSGFPGYGNSSGVTSYKPSRYDNVPYFQDLPMPEVIYSYVTVKSFGADYQANDEDDTEKDEETIYIFDVPDKSNIRKFFNLQTKQLSFGQVDRDGDGIPDYRDDDVDGNGIPNSQEYHSDDYFIDDPTLFLFPDGRYQNFYLCNRILHDNTYGIGRSLAIITKNKFGQSTNEILFDYWERDSLSGQFKETFMNRKNHKYTVTFADANASTVEANKWYLTCSSKILYPSVLRSIISIENGIPIISENKKFDFNTGNVVESEQANRKSFTIPAYIKYPEMGSKSTDITNKNMLSQSTSSYSTDQKDSVISIGIQTWKKDWKYMAYNSSSMNYSLTTITGMPDIYKKYQSYGWNGEIKDNGTIKNYKEFDWTKTENEIETYNEGRGWKKGGEVTLFSKYSSPLEIEDVNGNFSATRYGYNDKYVIAGISNSSYRCFGYTGFEYSKSLGSNTDFDGGFINKDTYSTLMISDYVDYDGTSGLLAGKVAHTGNYYLKIDGGAGPKFKMSYDITDPELGMKAGTYRASVWIMETSLTDVSIEVIPNIASFGGTIPSEYSVIYDPYSSDKIKVGDWVLISIEFTIPELEDGDYINLCVTSPTGIVYIDDFRIHPVDAPMTANVYDVKTGRVTATLDANNFSTFYEYDEAGRVTAIKKETIKYGVQTVKEYDYNYARQN